MNIVLTTDYFPPHVGGGVERATFHLASELVRLGHRVAVVTLNTRHANFAEILNGIRIYRAKPLSLTRTLGSQSAISLGVLQLVRKVCREEAADVLHANNLFFFTTIAACANKKRLRKSLVTTVHVGSTSQLPTRIRLLAGLYERFFGRWILAKSDHIVTVSQAVMKYARGLGAPPSKISVIPNAVDLEEFRPSSQKKRGGDVHVAFIGRLISNKGPQYLLEATPRILERFRNVRFLFVGEGPMLGQLRNRAKQLGLSDHLHFLGNVPSVSEFLTNCDILVRPSLTDGMPLTVLEAMACGVPNIASSVGGTSEIISHEKTGLLVDPKNVEQLASSVSRLIKDHQLRAGIVNRARSFVEKYHSWSESARQMTKIYESVTGRSS